MARSRLVLAALTGIIAMALVIPNHAQPKGKSYKPPAYKVAILDDYNNPLINDRGVIAAESELDGNAIRLTSDGVEVLWPGKAFDINVFGQVVGSSQGNAVISSVGTYIPLSGSQATGINDVGEAAGIAPGGAALWGSDGALTLLGEFNPRDVNDAQLIVGEQDSRSEGGTIAAVAWSGGVIQILGTLPGDDGGECVSHNGPCQSFANRVNSTGQIVGTSDRPGVSSKHAVIWTDDGIIDLGQLGGANSGSEGVDINDAGWVVGDSDSRAYVYDGTMMHDLNTLIRGRNRFTRLTTAHSINNRGDIVGQGFVDGVRRAYLARRVK